MNEDYSTKQHTAKERYEKLKEKREQYLDRARECSELTIPALIPEDGFHYTSELYTPFQSVGARGVNNLASKLLLLLLPPNSPFFRLSVSGKAKEQLDEQREMQATVEKSLQRIEKNVQNKIEELALRTSAFEAIKHLIVGGNVLTYLPKDGHMKVFPLTQYVCTRDSEGELLEVVIKESITPLSLDVEVRAQVISDPDYKEDEEVELYTHIYKLDNDKYYICQEVHGIKIPGSIGTFAKDAMPYMCLRMVRVDGEDINAAYFMADVNSGPWQVIAGARYEHEQRDARGTRYNDELNEFSPEYAEFSDAQWLPSLIGRYELSNSTIVRMAYSTGLVRPSFEQIRPSYFVENDDGDIKAEFGNPALEPLTSRNLDLGIEHYDETLGVISATAFYKSIKNFVYEADIAGRPGYESFDEAVTYINGDDAYVAGLEFNLVHQFSGFNNWLDNFLINTNLTFTDSEATVDWLDDGELMERDIPLPSQSDTTANVAIGYETQQLSLRLAANYKSKYLAELGDVEDSRYDIYEDDNLTLDFSSKWLISDQLSINFAVNNITDEAYFVYTGDKRYNAQYESYGRSYTLGVQWVNW